MSEFNDGRKRRYDSAVDSLPVVAIDAADGRPGSVALDSPSTDTGQEPIGEGVLAMDSDKISAEMKMALRAELPTGCRLLAPLHPSRVVAGRDPSLNWRLPNSLETGPGGKEALAGLLGTKPEQLPPGLSGDERIRWSPSRKRALVDGSYEKVWTFEFDDGIVDLSSQRAVPSINFDDDRRWFIHWHGFVNEDIIVGTMEDDPEIDAGVWRGMQLYTYNAENRALRRVVLPKEVIDEGSYNYSILAIAEGAALFRSADGDGVVTVRLSE